MNKHGIENGRTVRILLTTLLLLGCCSTVCGQYSLEWGRSVGGGGRSIGGSYLLIGGVGYGGVNGTFSSITSDPNLIGWWKFDEGTGNTAYDSAGSNDGTITGADWTSGMFGDALDFDGRGDYVETSESNIFNFADSVATISMWVNPNDRDADDLEGIWSIQDITGGGEFITSYQEDRDMEGRIDDGTDDFHWYIPIAYENRLQEDIWSNLVWIVDLTNGWEIKGYKDGTYIGSDSGTEEIDFSGDFAVSIGRHGWREADAKIDDVVIFNKALTEGEIKQLYKGTFNGTFCEGSADPVSGELGSDLSLSIDPFAGGVSYSLPIVLPPARQGSEPKLALRYGSGGGNGWCGTGWSIGMGMIQRDTRYGVPVDYDDPNDDDPNQYDDSKGFVAALGATGARLVLVDDVNNVYRAETDQAFLKYIFDKDNNQWIVVDKSGNKYYFGESSGGRMVHPDFVNQYGKNTFLWALEKIQDKNGNRTLIDYISDANQLYLDKISYNGNITSPTISESHTVDFIIEDRNDVSISYSTGYRVETKKRLSEIDIEVDGTQVRRYVMDYDYSPSTLRSLITSVTMYGSDDVSSLPPITFDYSELEFEFEDMNDFGELDSPAPYYDWNAPHNTNNLYGSTTCMLDINGDGLPDRVMREAVYEPQGGFTKFKVQLNTGDGFTEMQDWGPLDSPESEKKWNLPYGYDNGTCSTLIDINRDGLADRVMRESLNQPGGGWSKFVVQFNNGTGFDDAIDWEGVSSPALATPWWNPHGISYGTCATLMDINGDGLPDRVMRHGDIHYTEFVVQINNGTGFNPIITWDNLQNASNDPYWSSPQYNNDGTNEVDMLDINGDGLVDRVWRTYYSPYDKFKIQFNTGYGFADVEQWDIQSPSTSHVFNAPYGHWGYSTVTMLLDINGDGLPDRVSREALSKPAEGWSKYHVQINTGSGFSDPVYFTNLQSENTTSEQFYSPAGEDAYDNQMQVLMDINGDGLFDRVMKEEGTYPDTFKIQLNKGAVPDLLTKVNSSLGGSAEVTYKSSTQYDNKDHTGLHRLPFPVQTADTITLDDGFGHAHTTTYEYERGMFDFDEREFRGFGKVTVTDPCDTKSITYFHQEGGYEDPNNGEYQDANSVAKKGMPYRVEVYGSDANLYSVTINKVEEAEVESNSGWYFPYVSQTIKMDYEGTANYRAKVRQSTYDPNTGNILTSIDLGEVSDVNTVDHTFTDIGNDSLYIHTTYESFTDPNILNKIATTKTTTDSAGNNILKEIVFDYNDVTGNVVESKEWLDDINDYAGSTTYEYDQYGNRIKTTDPLGYITETEYDDTYVIYPVKICTADFITTAVYDVLSGLPLVQTDVMGITSVNVYDEFFRPTEVYTSREPYGDLNLCLTHIEYSMEGITGGITKNYVYQFHEGYEAYTYNDGLGRVVQTRVLAEPNAPSDCRVADVFYDARGNVYFESLPYFSNGTDFTIWNDNTDGVFTDFDALGRAYKVTPPSGDVDSPTGPSYTEFRDGNDLWVTVSTDPEGNKKKQYSDAQGRVTKLVEVMTVGDDIETFYEYDDLGRLIRTYDDANNVIEASYDSLGRKVDSNDPDMGFWTYAYDDIGRLIEQEDARGNVVEIFYDPNIDRISERKIYDANETLVETITYTYDSGETGYTVHKGQVFKIEDGQGWQKFGYDSRGRVIKSTRYINAKSKSYTTQTSYDEANRVTEIVYPDDRATVQYSYDSVGHLIKVEGTSGTPGGNEVFYEPEGFNVYGQLTGVNYGNGIESRYDFYTYSKRLKRISTYTDVNDPNTYIQHLTYKFDKVSNITSITDGIHSGSADGTLSSIVYDDLYRLKSLYNAGAASTLTYSYNAIGNITSNSEGSGSSYTYGGSRPHAVTSAYGKSYTYDACGNMITRGSDTLTYDARNRLVKVVKDANDIEFGYSGDGDRLYKKFNSTVTQVWIGDIYEEKDGKVLCHVFAGDKLIATFEPASALARFIDKHRLLRESYQYASVACFGMFGQGRTPLTLLGFGIMAGVFFGIRRRQDKRGGHLFFYKSQYRQFFGFTLIVAVFVATTPEICHAGTPTYDPVFYYYHSDHLGSSNIMTDRNGEMVQHYGYLSFGNERYANNTQAFSVTNRYTGQQLDEETGLYYYGARYYDPELGRFIQPDNIVPDYNTSQVLNRYTYCNNNPLIFVDPSGNFFGIIAAVASFIAANATVILASAALSAGIAAIQGGNVWKAAAAGALAGAFSGWGIIGSMAGGALGALITGDDPGMAAATAAVVTVVVEVASLIISSPGQSQTLQEQNVTKYSETNGSNSTGGGTSYEFELEPMPLAHKTSASGYVLESKTISHHINFESKVKVVKDGVVDGLKEAADAHNPVGETVKAIDKAIEEGKKLTKPILKNMGEKTYTTMGQWHAEYLFQVGKASKDVWKGPAKDVGSALLGKAGGALVEHAPISGEIKKTLLQKVLGHTKKGLESIGGAARWTYHRIRGKKKTVEQIKKN